MPPARAVLHPGLGFDAGAKDRRAHVPPAHLALDDGGQVGEFAARDQDQVRARQARGRLAQAAQRKDLAAAKRVQGVDQHHVHVARQPLVLEPVVQQQHVRAEIAHQQRAGLETVRSNAHRRQARADEYLRLVAGMLGAHNRAGRERQVLLGRVAAVAARQDSRPAPPLLEDLGQQQHAGRFAGAAHGDVADR